jgi:hypothetical protein
MLSCISGDRFQITERADYDARLGGSVDDFIYAALRPLPTELGNMQAQKLFDRSVPHPARAIGDDRLTSHLGKPPNFKRE